jgi:hypothetical protein
MVFSNRNLQWDLRGHRQVDWILPKLVGWAERSEAHQFFSL